MEERGLCLWVKIIFMLKLIFFNLQLLGEKMSYDTSQIKRGKYSFAMLCRWSNYLKKTASIPTLNGGDREGVPILLYNVSTILLLIVG